MSREEIVADLARRKVIEQLIQQEVPEVRFEHLDLSQDLYLDLLQKPEEKLQKLQKENKLQYYILGMIRKNIHSSTSRFYYQYRKFSRLNNGTEVKEYREATWED